VSTVVAIVDYGVGNLFSVERACAAAGMNAVITYDADVIRSAAAVVLPGIGAFGDAMAAIARLNLVECLRSLPARGTRLLGVCLGMQLLVEQSHEFGCHEGLGLIAGSVERLEPGEPHKIPHVGWSPIVHAPAQGADPWSASLLRGTANGEPMYFVHSYAVRPRRGTTALAETVYGDQRFCAAFCHGLVTGVQFHPERSGPAGLQVYRNLAADIRRDKER
jgi:imidazole glycerol-phosphate synthase subunit HisH